MIFHNLPKISRLSGGAQTLVSPEFSLDNYRVVAFIADNPDANELSITVKAMRDGGAAIAIPFLIREGDGTKYEAVSADGRLVENAGTVTVVVTADSLSQGGYDRVILSLGSNDKNISTVYALQTEPRYAE